MCLVEVEKSPKPIAACAMPVMAGMRINTKSEKTKIARGGVMEFLLANHPLDCPICDQGGECDLQDISEVYGYRQSRFFEFKRGVEDKNFGPLVRTVMTRCIHCTRCVRFTEEVAGNYSLGTTGRGRGTEIGTYIENLLTNELSANVIDLCPVGALTNRPYAMKARPWELKSTHSIDIFEPIIPVIQIDNRGAEVMRVLPRIHEDVNEEWISDKSRFAFDGIKRQRLNVPMMKDEKGNFVDTTWEDALEKAAEMLTSTNPKDIGVMIGDQADCETITSLRDMMHGLGVENLEFKSNGLKVDPSIRSGYLMNSRLRGVEDADLLLLIGTNPKVESPVFNARIRKAVVKNNLSVGLIGSAYDLTYEYDHLGTSPKTIIDLLDGKHPFSARISNVRKNWFLI
jgi:NADH dehydrogenase (ubiquinone) Fe-S protein 1